MHVSTDDVAVFFGGGGPFQGGAFTTERYPPLRVSQGDSPRFLVVRTGASEAGREWCILVLATF
jgi:hypothetical protein